MKMHIKLEIHTQHLKISVDNENLETENQLTNNELQNGERNHLQTNVEVTSETEQNTDEFSL